MVREGKKREEKGREGKKREEKGRKGKQVAKQLMSTTNVFTKGKRREEWVRKGKNINECSPIYAQ
jgi:hypothetical protein